MNNRIQTYYTFWRCSACPCCQSKNWTYDSHSEKAYPDICDGVKCWKCEFLYFLGDKSEFEGKYAVELENNAVEKVFEEFLEWRFGLKEPK